MPIIPEVPEPYDPSPKPDVHKPRPLHSFSAPKQKLLGEFLAEYDEFHKVRVSLAKLLSEARERNAHHSVITFLNLSYQDVVCRLLDIRANFDRARDLFIQIEEENK